MTAVRARLEDAGRAASRRKVARKTLRLGLVGTTGTGTSEVLILNVSRTGLLLQTAAQLKVGEGIAITIPQVQDTRAIVQWSSGEYYGCEFEEPISSAAVSACLLQADPEPISDEPPLLTSQYHLDTVRFGKESALNNQRALGTKMRWIVGLTILSWLPVAVIAALIF